MRYGQRARLVLAEGSRPVETEPGWLATPGWWIEPGWRFDGPARSGRAARPRPRRGRHRARPAPADHLLDGDGPWERWHGWPSMVARVPPVMPYSVMAAAVVLAVAIVAGAALVAAGELVPAGAAARPAHGPPGTARSPGPFAAASGAAARPGPRRQVSRPSGPG